MTQAITENSTGDTPDPKTRAEAVVNCWEELDPFPRLSVVDKGSESRANSTTIPASSTTLPSSTPRGVDFNVRLLPDSPSGGRRWTQVTWEAAYDEGKRAALLSSASWPPNFTTPSGAPIWLGAMQPRSTLFIDPPAPGPSQPLYSSTKAQEL
jgi:hypothetical protein